MKIITRKGEDFNIKYMEICCFTMSQKIKNTRFSVESGHLWINQNIIKFCESCGELIKVIEEGKEK